MQIFSVKDVNRYVLLVLVLLLNKNKLIIVETLRRLQHNTVELGCVCVCVCDLWTLSQRNCVEWKIMKAKVIISQNSFRIILPRGVTRE